MHLLLFHEAAQTDSIDRNNSRYTGDTDNDNVTIGTSSVLSVTKTSSKGAEATTTSFAHSRGEDDNWGDAAATQRNRFGAVDGVNTNGKSARLSTTVEAVQGSSSGGGGGGGGSRGGGGGGSSISSSRGDKSSTMGRSGRFSTAGRVQEFRAVLKGVATHASKMKVP